MVNEFIVEKDGKKYVYKSTSVYDHRQNRKRTVTEYVGKMDSETGEILKKDRTRVSQYLTSRLGSHTIRRFGASYALFHLAESSGIREDLKESFGYRGDLILSIAISTILACGPRNYMEPEVETNMASELLGVHNDLKTSTLLEEINFACDDQGGVDRFRRLRMNHALGTTLYCRPYRFPSDSIQDWGGLHVPDWLNQSEGYFLAADQNGIPAFFIPFEGDKGDTQIILDLIDDLTEYDAKEPAIYLDPDVGKADTLAFLISQKVPFVAVAGKNTPAIKPIMAQIIKKRKDPRYLRTHEGHEYVVYNMDTCAVRRDADQAYRSVSDSNDTDDWELISASDPRFNKTYVKDRMVAWGCTRNDTDYDELRNMIMGDISSIESLLQQMDPSEAVNKFKNITGDFSRFFELNVKEDGLDIRVRQNSITAVLNRLGIDIILSYSVNNWNDAMQHSICGERLERLWQDVLPELEMRTMSEVSPTPNAKMMIQFVASMLWTSLERRLEKSKSDLSVRSVLQILDTIQAIWSGSEWLITDFTPMCIQIMKDLHMPFRPMRIHSHYGLVYNIIPSNRSEQNQSDG